MRFNTKLIIGCVSVLCFTYPAQSAPDITQAVSQDCRWGYHNFCLWDRESPSELLLS
jgi:hypothetical protein